jgi:putative long chain acyl-CoA synthase
MNTSLLPSRLTGPLDRAVATAVNGLEVARFGGLRTDDEPSPYEVVAHQPVYRLRRYFPDVPAGSRPPVLLVPPLMMTAEVWDVSPQSSAVTMLRDQAIDPWVVDFGDPDREPGGTERNVTDHVLAVVDAVDRVRRATGQDVHMGGYSQGGLFCYQAAAYRNCDGIASIFVLGTPVKEPFLIGEGYVPEDVAADLTRLETRVLSRTGLPGWAVGRMFKLINPVNALRQELTFLRALHDREALLPRERQRRFLAREGWVSWSGPAIAEVMEILSDDRYLKGGLVFGDRAVGLADVTCPVLLFMGEADGMGPPPLVRAIVRAAPHAEVYECVLPVGHFGLPVGRWAARRTWPGVAGWIRWLSNDGSLPEDVHRVVAEAADGNLEKPAPRGLGPSVTYGLGLAAGAALSVPGSIARTGKQAVDTTLDVSREAVAQLPRLARLESMGPRTRISWGSLLDDAARRQPDNVAFLFEDRAHSHAAAKRRIDNVVRGLISLGVRKGEHVGVLMGTRPSALVTVAALNRLGAVAVMLRPGGSLAREAMLGQLSRVVADPEHAAAAAELGVEVFVLGGAGARRDVPSGTVDMERIDPNTVDLPAWYRANPGRARDLAFILFTGSGDRTRADRITNGRWARSALGAASSASLTPSDTIYSVNPLHHPSGLLLATAASAAGGSRLAMATRFDPATFWSEVRRYGATVVPYTWTMLQELVDAAPHPEERHHPIRLFVGSGMPRNLWRRVLDRFSPAAVLELYASTRTGAIVGNVSGRKIGALGQPLPGMPRVRVAAYDIAAGRLEIGGDGFAIPCDDGETGMLLVEADGAAPTGQDVPLRGVFKPDDAWIATGDLFRRDGDGDLWLVDDAAALIATKHGTISPRAVQDALGELAAVDLAACYGVERETDGAPIALVAVTLRPGHALNAAAVGGALQALAPDARPDVVHVLDTMPLTSWFRPSVPELQDAHRRPNAGRGAWRRDPRTGRYRTIKTTRRES